MSEFIVPKGWIKGEPLEYAVKPVWKHDWWAIRRSSNRPVTPSMGAIASDEVYALTFPNHEEINKFIRWWKNDSPSKTGQQA